DASGAAAGGEAPAIARDGSVVVLESAARLLAADCTPETGRYGFRRAAHSTPDRAVYAFRVATHDLLLASVSSAGACGRGWTAVAEAGAPARMRGDSTAPSVSGDGRFVVFVSLARDLAPGAPLGAEGYLRDLAASTTRSEEHTSELQS